MQIIYKIGYNIIELLSNISICTYRYITNESCIIGIISGIIASVIVILVQNNFNFKYKNELISELSSLAYDVKGFEHCINFYCIEEIAAYKISIHTTAINVLKIIDFINVDNKIKTLVISIVGEVEMMLLYYGSCEKGYTGIQEEKARFNDISSAFYMKENYLSDGILSIMSVIKGEIIEDNINNIKNAFSNRLMLNNWLYCNNKYKKYVDNLDSILALLEKDVKV